MNSVTMYTNDCWRHTPMNYEPIRIYINTQAPCRSSESLSRGVSVAWARYLDQMRVRVLMDGLLAIEILLDIILAHHVAVDLLDCDRGTEVIAQEHRSERALKQERESFVVCVGGLWDVGRVYAVGTSPMVWRISSSFSSMKLAREVSGKPSSVS